jgi:hypothetical protein
MIEKLQRRNYQIALVAAFACAVRACLILAFPIIFGGDSMVRLVNRNHVLLSYQLPLLQFLIFCITQLTSDILWIRFFLAGIGVLAALGFYLLAEDFAGSEAAFWAALLFATNPLILPVSIVPYQEILMLTLLLFGFHFFLKEQWIAASICLGLACFTRYEAWAACPAMIFFFARNRRFTPSAIGKACALFAWAPVIWLCFRTGLSPAGSFVLDQHISFLRLQRLAYLGFITARESTIPTLLLAIAGAIFLIRTGKWREQRIQLWTITLCCFLAAILFSAHGVPPDPERYVTSREAHMPLAAMTLLAALGLARQRRGLASLLACSGVLLGLYGAVRFVVKETSRPDVRLGYELARYLDRNVANNESVLVLARPIDDETLGMYFNELRRVGGEQAVRDGRQVLATVDTSPLDYQRTVIHSRLARNHLQSSYTAGSQFRWVAVWSDFTPRDAGSAYWLRIILSQPVAVLRVGARSVAVYHFPQQATL